MTVTTSLRHYAGDEIDAPGQCEETSRIGVVADVNEGFQFKAAMSRVTR